MGKKRHFPNSLSSCNLCKSKHGVQLHSHAKTCRLYSAAVREQLFCHRSGGSWWVNSSTFVFRDPPQQSYCQLVLKIVSVSKTASCIFVGLARLTISVQMCVDAIHVSLAQWFSCYGIPTSVELHRVFNFLYCLRLVLEWSQNLILNYFYLSSPIMTEDRDCHGCW